MKKVYGKYSLKDNIKFILKHIHDTDKGTMPIILVGIIPPVALQLLNVWLVKVLVDSLTQGAAIKSLFVSVAVFVVLMIFVQLCLAISQAVRLPKIEMTILSFSKRIMQKALTMDYDFLESPKGRFMLNHASNFISQRYVGLFSFCYSITDFLSAVLGIFSFGAIITMASPYVLLLNLVIGIVIFLLQLRRNKGVTKIREDADKITYKHEYITTGTPTEMQAGKDIRVYGISVWFSNVVKSLFADYYVLLKEFNRIGFWVSFGKAVCMLVRDGGTLGILLNMAVAGKISPGDFFLYITVIRSFAAWFQDLAQRVAVMMEISDRCGEARRFLDYKDKSEQRGNESLDGKTPYTVEFKNVSFSYDSEKYALKNVSFKVNAGEKIAIVGSNGAGKTTAMKLLTGLYTPQRGQILINGKDMQDVSRDEWFGAFSALFQDTFVLPATVVENVSMRTKEETDMDKLRCVLEKAGIAEKIDSLPDKENSLLNRDIFENAVNFSGGEMQRIFLARALYKNAPIVILDEPTSALDPIAENELYLRYNEMTKEKTSFYISHRLSSTGFCDRIFFFKDGEIAEEGSHQTLMEKKGEYYKMYETQSYYYREQVGEAAGDEKF